MAIYSLNHRSVGKKTHAPRTAGAHVRYITRPNAVGQVLAQHMPEKPGPARAWFDAQEASDRANARIADKIMVALPVELNAVQHAQLVRDFAYDVTQGRAPWLAAIHDRGEDAHNPHAHIMIRDRDVATGKRAIGLSEKGSTERLRELWEVAANRSLAQAGHDTTIDRRTLEAQGITREPGLHVGHTGPAMEEKGLRPESRAREGEGGRIIDYLAIDTGRTRGEANAEIAAANLALAGALEVAQPSSQDERQQDADREHRQQAEAASSAIRRAAAALVRQQAVEREEFTRFSLAGRARAALEAAASVVAAPRPGRLVALFQWITGRSQRDRTRLEAERRRRIADAVQRHNRLEEDQRAALALRQAAELAAVQGRQVERQREPDRGLEADLGDLGL
jgi:hypothetical protein